MTHPVRRTVFAILVYLFSSRTSLQAQFLGLNLRGDTGVQSGTQPDPGYYFVLPIYYRSDYSSLRNANGDELAPGLDPEIKVLGPSIAITTDLKLAGANYGFQVVPIFFNQRLAFAGSGVEVGGDYGFGDMYVQPINLGWRLPRADVLFAYGFYAPTGSGRRSLDMWAHEVVGGTTVYLDGGKAWNASGTAYYEFHQKKEGLDLRVGQILTVEGGVARSFLKGAGHAGAAYVAQWKLTNDSGSDFPAFLPKSKSRAFGLGPDIALPVFKKGPVVGLVNFRYVWEFGARTNFEGNTMVLSFTLAKPRIR